MTHSYNTHTNTQTHAVYGNEYMVQRSPALQPPHSFSALYANTARASVRDRHPNAGADYLYKRLRQDRKEAVSSDVWIHWGSSSLFLCTVEVRSSGSYEPMKLIVLISLRDECMMLKRGATHQHSNIYHLLIYKNSVPKKCHSKAPSCGG